MPRYSEERKQAVIEKMMPPQNQTIPALSKETGISSVTLYHWRKQAKEKGLAVPGDGKNPENWSAQDKFAVVVETAAFNEVELAQYCRKKGLFAEQVAAWRQVCKEANAEAVMSSAVTRQQAQKDKKRIRELEKDLRRKEKALAETAALLVLRKKLGAIWGKDEDE
jgi:transposase